MNDDEYFEEFIEHSKESNEKYFVNGFEYYVKNKSEGAFKFSNIEDVIQIKSTMRNTIKLLLSCCEK